MGETAAEAFQAISQVGPLQNRDQESSINFCSDCKKAEASRDGLCLDCALIRKRREGVRNKALAEMLEMFGEGAIERFTFERFQTYDDMTRQALEKVKAFHPSTSNLYLCGVTGCGKTHLGVAAALKAFEGGSKIRFFASGPALSRYLRGLDGIEEERRIDELAKVDVLVINELGIGRDTEFSIATAVEIVDRRIMRGKNGLIVTSNLHPSELAIKANDARLESRFSGLCKIIEVGEKDYRKEHRVG